MTLQTSSTITLAQIQSEHGGSNPIGMNEYYRGGSNVQNHNNTDGTFNPTAIPTSGTISMSQFYGSSNNATVTSNSTATMSVGTATSTDKFPNSYAGYNATSSGFTGGVGAIGSASDNTMKGSNGTEYTIKAVFTSTGISNFCFIHVIGNYGTTVFSNQFGYNNIKWGGTTIGTGGGTGNYSSTDNYTSYVFSYQATASGSNQTVSFA